jgi:hypothetical protein
MTTRTWNINGNSTTIDGAASTAMDKNYQCIEIVLMQNGGGKFWSLKSYYKSA